MFVGEEAQGLMSGGANDPFHVVKDELVAKLESIELRVGQFNGLLYGPGTTAGSKPFRDCRKALGREIRGAEGQLKDLGLTVEYVEREVGPAEPLPSGCAVVSVHGCGKLTDTIIAAAVAADARSVALMPCCYAQSAAHAPQSLRLP